MGLTKQYLRYVSSAFFGIVGSPKSNVVYVDTEESKGKLVAVPAVEHVFIWDVRKGEKVMVLQGDKHEVTAIAKSPDKKHLAVGYNNGTIQIFDMLSGDSNVTFNGHKSAVSSLNYDSDGTRLVSGSKDTDVIVWDVVNESGLYRLKGHKGMVTQCQFMRNRNFLLSSSKDTYIKFWDLDTQHCFKTVVGHRTEVWGFVLTPDEKRLITGCMDSELRVWDITYTDQIQDEDSPQPAKKMRIEETDKDDDEDDETVILTCTKVGSIMRQSREKLVSMAMDKTGRVLACHGSDSSLEVFLISNEDELTKRLKKKQKKARKKKASEETTGDGEDNVEESVTLAIEDEIKRLSVIRASHKIRSFDFILERNKSLRIVFLLGNNSLESFVLSTIEKKPEPTNHSLLSMPGHRNDVRTVCFSSDDTAVLSASGESVKIWNRSTQQCIRTMKCGYALCSMFVPGDRHCLIGTKAGKLQIFDIAAGQLIESVNAHEGAVWTIALSPDKRGFVTGSADKTVKFWEFELIKDEQFSKSSKRLSANHTRTLKMSDDVLCIRYTPDQRLLAVSLLDNTVKVFFTDTLKFFLSLYGHKLPVLTMDISSDSQLLITGSADRNVKLWGLDFGDCHKSIFAHDDSIMCMQFIPKTHMFFTGGKDMKIKQWDGDKYEQIQTLEGNHGEVWCLAVSHNGDCVMSGSHDKSLRLWDKTQEILVLEEEKEMEREAAYEESVAQEDEPVVAGEASGGEVAMAGKKTIETVKSAERIMEAIVLYKEETQKLQEHEAQCKALQKQLPPPQTHPVLQAYGNLSPSKYVLEILKRVKSSELEKSLLVLPFDYVIDLLKLLDIFIKSGFEVELSCRCLFFLLRVNHGQITSNQVLLPVINSLRSCTVSKISELRDTIGFNMAGLQFIQREMELKQDVQFFADATSHFQEKKRKTKRKEKAMLAVRS
ncbi:WD repeat-containing protein 3-like [Ptychodera flava]|uniref:WD repeat-containing protein 3-like n=1 Tax=Ptychodera flava TaxID=63121 RepID=UPI003969F11B